jgi:hypothetical protein
LELLSGEVATVAQGGGIGRGFAGQLQAGDA